MNKMKDELRDKGEVYMKVKVRPSASETCVRDIMDDETIKIDVAATPTKGKANKELIKFIGRELEVLEKNVIIISGAKERVKIIKVVV